MYCSALFLNIYQNIVENRQHWYIVKYILQDIFKHSVQMWYPIKLTVAYIAFYLFDLCD